MTPVRLVGAKDVISGAGGLNGIAPGVNVRSTVVPLFVVLAALIISMYGGGFATIPAYLRDLFGTMHLGAIHGRLITAWSMAAVVGPQVLNYSFAYLVDHGTPRAEAYNATMYVMSGLLLIGLVCNLCVRPVDPRHHHREGA